MDLSVNVSQEGATVTLSPDEGLGLDLGSTVATVTAGPISVSTPSSMSGSQSASNSSLLNNISIDGNPLTAIQGALSSLAGAGAAPTTTQSSQSIGSVSLVEDATKTLFVSFKNTL